MNSIGDIIRDNRKKAKISQNELAKGICSQSYIGMVERGVHIPNRKILEKIFDKLNVSIENIPPDEMKKIKSASTLADYPELMEVFHPYKNRELNITPNNISVGSHKKIWWLGKCGHEWLASPRDKCRALRTGCPYCSNKKIIKSNSLLAIYPEIAEEWNYEKNGNLTPDKVAPRAATVVWWRCEKGHEWQVRVANRTGKKTKGCPVCNSERRKSFPEYALLYYFSKVSTEVIHSYNYYGTQELDLFIPSKNIGIEYDGVFFHKKIQDRDIRKNIKCSELGITLYRIRERGLEELNSTSIDIICDDNLDEIIEKLIYDIFAIDVVIDLENDRAEIEKLQFLKEKDNSLAKKYPIIAKQWHPIKNGIRTPENTSCFHSRKVWWVCDKKHDYQATTGHRIEGTGCPYCANEKLLVGYNDLMTIAPLVGAEWHPSKNGGLTPTNVIAFSPKKVWWLGKCGHEYKTRINMRVNGSRCPVCASRTIISGINDFEKWCLDNDKRDILLDWDYEKNEKIKPNEIAVCANRKVWWKCHRCGNNWQVKVYERTSTNKTGCPYCAGKKVKAGYNDLLSKEPALCKEWNYEKNVNILPSEISYSSRKKVWWRCSLGHEYEATVDNRRGKGRGCPYCHNKRVLSGYNDLKTTFPDIAKEWNYEKNVGLQPEMVTAGSNKIVWWKCEFGHEWAAMINSRKRGTKCPYCSKRKSL